MNVQSLSICVPCGCPNKCPFCVSRMRDAKVGRNMLKYNNCEDRSLAERMILDRMNFARDNDCNTVILTGTGEPMTNVEFLKDFGHWNKTLDKPFRWIEIQTSGVNMNRNTIIFLRDVVGVNTISLSCVDILSDSNNRSIMGLPEKTKRFSSLCKMIKDAKVNLRISLNMTDVLNDYELDDIFFRLKDLGANQVTFRELYTSGNDLEQDQWISEHNCSSEKLIEFIMYIKENGRALEPLPFGAIRYSCNKISTLIDNDCMSKNENNDAIKYLILNTDCHLYTKWDDESSLLF